MSDLVQLEEQLLAHNLQRAHFSCIFLRCKVDLSVAALSDLSKDLEVTMLQSSTAFSEVGSLSAQVFVSCGFIFFCRRRWRWWKLGVECSLTALAVRNVTKKVKVMIKEV